MCVLHTYRNTLQNIKQIGPYLTFGKKSLKQTNPRQSPTKGPSTKTKDPDAGWENPTSRLGKTRPVGWKGSDPPCERTRIAGLFLLTRRLVCALSVSTSWSKLVQVLASDNFLTWTWVGLKHAYVIITVGHKWRPIYGGPEPTNPDAYK